MRLINADELTPVVSRLCIEANCFLPEDVQRSIRSARESEDWPVAREILDRIIENFTIAADERVPICQDTGVACVFLEIGCDVHIEGDIQAAVDAGVRDGYAKGYLRCSVVSDPLRRINTGDNTPAMLYIDIVPGSALRVTVAPKGFGSENMSRIKMLKPSDGVEGVIDFVVSAVEEAGPNPCPPTVVGVGIGATFDRCALLAKKALLRNVDERNPDPFYAALEEELLERINALGVGPQGLGGRTSALAVNILACPTHIAGLPVAVNINCHVTRHRTEVL